MIHNFVKNLKQNKTPKKDVIRHNTCKFIHSFFLNYELPVVEFYTLPSAWWKFEAMVLRRFYEYKEQVIKPKFTACEKDYKIFSLASLQMPRTDSGISQLLDDDLNCQVVSNLKTCEIRNCDFFEYAAATDKKFNCIWADTNSPVTTFEDELPALLDTLDLNSPAVFAITVLKARESRPLGMTRTEFLNSIIEPYGLMLEQEHEYCDSSPMLHLIYTNSEVSPKTAKL